MRLGSLFDGIGGWLIAAQKCGVVPIWASEIAPFPIAVTKEHFPNVQHLGDIRDIDGTKIEPVDIVTMGSPCTNLSIAGNRAGLQGKESCLFHEGIRIIKEMRQATGGRFPKCLVWENVPYALGSNKGNDFRTVLEEITETSISMPPSGRWARAGLVRSRKCTVAWRILNAQYFGLAQRRARLFLIADFTTNKGCAEEILFESSRLQWNPPESRKEKEGASVRAKGNIDIPNQVTIYDMTHADEVMRLVKGDKCQTLNARMGTGGNQVPVIVFAIDGNGTMESHKGLGYSANDKSYTLNTVERHAVAVCATNKQVHNSYIRRLTPLECERLQGLPDNYTLIDDKTCNDAARYRALGNGMAQPCADYIMKRVVLVLSGKK